MIEILPNELTSQIEKILSAWDVDSEVATCVARNMTSAHQHGHPTHGVQLLPRYQKWLKNKILNPLAKKSTISITNNLIHVDGLKSFGHWCLPEIIRETSKLESPVKAFKIQNLGHTGYVAECLRESNVKNHMMLLWINTSGSKLVKPYGGSGKLMSTSVLAAMAPGGYVLDMSTSSTAENSVHYSMLSEKSLNVDLILEDGSVSRNPRDLYSETEFGLNPLSNQTAIGFKDHKMFNLAIIAELLAGVITDSGTSKEKSFHSGCFGFLVETTDQNDSQIREYLRWIRNGSSLRLPGDNTTPTIILQPWELKILEQFKEI